jgi:hypothetical protein
MATSTRKPSASRATAGKRAAKQAEALAENLRSFAASLLSLEDATPATKVTPRNWWRVQAGRFKDDPTFPDFVARVQAARRQEG